MSATQRRLLQALLQAGVLLALVVLAFAIWIARDGLADRVFPSDLVVVLGGQIQADGQPSPWLQARLDQALELYNEGISHRILVSGGMNNGSFNETRVMQAYLVKKGVPADKIWTNERGESMRQTASYAAELMRKQGWNSVILVSQFYEMPRARLAFEQAGVQQVGSAAAHGFFFMDIPGLLGEEVFYPYYWLDGMQSR